jgi:hypothetical protein
MNEPPNLVEVEVVAKAIYESVFDERWDELLENSIDRKLYRQVAAAAIDRLDRLRNPGKR